jgi:hypothetical protein
MILNNDDLFLEIINKPIYKNNSLSLSLNNISMNIKNLLNIQDIQYKKFITFGGPTTNFHNNVERICLEAKNIDFFNEVKGFTDIDLKNDEIFWNKNSYFIQNNSRGYGYWIWKPYLIKKTLEELNDNDILVYCDSGCQINNNGKQRFYEYIDMLNSNKENYGIISFQLEFNEIQYTKKQIFDKLHSDNEHQNKLQCLATIIILKKNIHSINIINEWYNNSQIYNLINDDIENEDNNFIENRHDQSILSVLVNKYNSIKIKDETYFHPNWEKDGNLYPFWARRIK